MLNLPRRPSRHRRPIRLLPAALAIGWMWVFAPTPAHAAFPGGNGKVAFDRGGDIYAVNADGTGVTNLTNTGSGDGDNFPAWSPDGTRIAFARIPAGSNLEIYTMNADGTNQTRLTNNSSTYDNHPAWSPDGQKIVFTSNRDLGGSGYDIYTMNSDGTGVTRLTTDGAGNVTPAWSPDGTKIAFQRGTSVSGYQVYVMNANGTGAAPLASGEIPDWSPDGTKLVFGRRITSSDYEVFSMNANGTSQVNLTNTPSALDDLPAWSPDGTKIVFSSNRTGVANRRLYTMNPNGTSQTALTAGTTDVRSDWQPLVAPLKTANSLSVSLVPVYRPCGTGGNPVNATHGPPALSGSPSDGSCTPTAFTGTARLGPQAVGSATVTVIPGNLATPGDEADDHYVVSLTDVRTATWGDYNPSAGADMTAVARIRITDTFSCSPTPCSGVYAKRATVTDLDFAVPVSCASTASLAVGATCSVDTSANALIPTVVREGKQGVLSFFRVRLNDSGPDGVRGNSDDKLLAQQGIYNP